MNGKLKWDSSQRHPVSFLATLLGVDRLTLARRLITRFGTSQKKFTVAEAFDAWTSRSEAEEARRRKNIADAENAELDARKKKGEMMPRVQHRHVLADFGVQTRTIIQGPGWKTRKELLKLINAIKPLEPK